MGRSANFGLRDLRAAEIARASRVTYMARNNTPVDVVNSDTFFFAITHRRWDFNMEISKRHTLTNPDNVWGAIIHPWYFDYSRKLHTVDVH